MDILRILALAVILCYHFLADVYQRGLCEIRHPDDHFVIGNINLVIVAVGVFFVLSGAGLVLSLKDRELDIKKFYLGRWKRILIPFYVTYIAYLVFKLIGPNYSGQPLFQGARWYRAVYTVLGIDEYMKMSGFPDYSLGIGEWYLGALIIMYAVFPFIYKAMKRWRWPTLAAAAVYFAIVAATYHNDIVPMHCSVFVRIFEFIAGMFIGFLLNDRRPGGNTPERAEASTEAKADGEMCPRVVHTSSVPMYLSAIANFTYYFYLLHHIVIYLFDEPMQQAHMILSKPRLVVLFGAEVVVTIALALAVKFVSERLWKRMK